MFNYVTELHWPYLFFVLTFKRVMEDIQTVPLFSFII